MVFGLGCDRTLWLILKNDKRNRKTILNFIKSIPSSIFVEIRKKIEEARNSSRMFEYYEFKFKGIVYFFTIDKKDNFVSIGSHFKKKYRENDIYFLKLSTSLALADGEKKGIGTFMYQRKDEYGNFDSDKVQYHIVNKIKSYFIKVYDFNTYITRIRNRFDINNVPDSVSLDNLSKLETDPKRRTLNNVINFLKKF